MLVLGGIWHDVMETTVYDSDLVLKAAATFLTLGKGLVAASEENCRKHLIAKHRQLTLSGPFRINVGTMKMGAGLRDFLSRSLRLNKISYSGRC